MKYSIKDGWVVDEEGRCSLSERQLREAGVEFWGEIERLQAVNAELLAALQILASPDMWEFIEGEISGQDGWACNCFIWKGARTEGDIASLRIKRITSREFVMDDRYLPRFSRATLMALGRGRDAYGKEGWRLTGKYPDPTEKELLERECARFGRWHALTEDQLRRIVAIPHGVTTP